MDGDFVRRASGVGALADPVRLALYRYVVAADGPVGRDQAAAALELPRHVARFHLDRLVEAGLLVADYRRLTGRSGPGAGRPAKVYRRSDAEVAVSVPERSYDLAAALMAEAIDAATRTGRPVAETLAEAASARGRSLAAGTSEPGRAALCAALERAGYAPRDVGDEVVLANCPFHGLVREHAELVCGMNLALLTGLGEPLGARVRLEPAEGRCCVVLSVA